MITVSFDDIFYLRPQVITVTDGATGLPVNPYDLREYALSTAGGSPQRSRNVQGTAYASVRRGFGGAVPLDLKAGVDFRRSRSDNRTTTLAYNYVGADGRASTVPAGSDDGAAAFFDPYFFQRAGLFGIPRVQWVSNEAVLDRFKASPGQFTSDENAVYRSQVNSSKLSRELISSAYLRADLAFLQRRLKFTTGLRAEQTNVSAEGPLSDPARNFQRDAAGRLVLGANGRPLTRATAPLEVSRLTFLDREASVRK